jgi:hypothetical protein
MTFSYLYEHSGCRDDIVIHPESCGIFAEFVTRDLPMKVHTDERDERDCQVRRLRIHCIEDRLIILGYNVPFV